MLKQKNINLTLSLFHDDTFEVLKVPAAAITLFDFLPKNIFAVYSLC